MLGIAALLFGMGLLNASHAQRQLESALEGVSGLRELLDRPTNFSRYEVAVGEFMGERFDPQRFRMAMRSVREAIDRDPREATRLWAPDGQNPGFTLNGVRSRSGRTANGEAVRSWVAQWQRELAQQDHGGWGPRRRDEALELVRRIVSRMNGDPSRSRPPLTREQMLQDPQIQTLLTHWTAEYLGSQRLRYHLQSDDADSLIDWLSFLQEHPDELINGAQLDVIWPERLTEVAQHFLGRFARERLMSNLDLFPIENGDIQFAPVDRRIHAAATGAAWGEGWTQNIYRHGVWAGRIQAIVRRDQAGLEYGELRFEGSILSMSLTSPARMTLFQYWLDQVQPRISAAWRNRLAVQDPPEWLRRLPHWFFGLQVSDGRVYLERSPPEMLDAAALERMFSTPQFVRSNRAELEQSQVSGWLDALHRLPDTALSDGDGRLHPHLADRLTPLLASNHVPPESKTWILEIVGRFQIEAGMIGAVIGARRLSQEHRHLVDKALNTLKLSRRLLEELLRFSEVSQNAFDRKVASELLEHLMKLYPGTDVNLAHYFIETTDQTLRNASERMLKGFPAMQAAFDVLRSGLTNPALHHRITALLSSMQNCAAEAVRNATVVLNDSFQPVDTGRFGR